jgi:hypothetical protein
MFEISEAEIEEKIRKATPKMEKLGIKEYTLVLEHGLGHEFIELKNFGGIYDAVKKMSEVVVDEVKSWGIQVTKGWNFSITRLLDMYTPPINELVICPFNNYILLVDMKAKYDGKEYSIGKINAGEFPVNGLVTALNLKYDKTKGRFSFKNNPLMLNLGDQKIRPYTQITAGITQSCLLEFCEDLLEKNEKYAPGDVLNSIVVLVNTLLKKHKDNLEVKKAILSDFYTNPLILLDQNPEKATKSY